MANSYTSQSGRAASGIMAPRPWRTRLFLQFVFASTLSRIHSGHVRSQYRFPPCADHPLIVCCISSKQCTSSHNRIPTLTAIEDELRQFWTKTDKHCLNGRGLLQPCFTMSELPQRTLGEGLGWRLWPVLCLSTDAMPCDGQLNVRIPCRMHMSARDAKWWALHTVRCSVSFVRHVYMGPVRVRDHESMSRRGCGLGSIAVLHHGDESRSIF